MPGYSPALVPITIPPLAFGATGTNIPDAFVHTATGSGVAHMERVTKERFSSWINCLYSSSSGVTPQRPEPKEPFAFASYRVNTSSLKYLPV